MAGPLKWLELRLAEIEANIRRFETKRDLLHELIADWERHNPPESVTTVMAQVPPDGPIVSPSPGDAIDMLMADEPGLTRKQITDRLVGKTSSTAKNERAVILTNLSRRIRDGRLYGDRSGRLYARDHPTASAARRVEAAKERELREFFDEQGG